MTSPSSEFCGIDPAAMNAMAADLRQAADRLTAFSTDFEGLFRANGVSTAPLSQITAIADWGRKQAPMLSERAELIKALNGTGDNTFARLPDALDSFATGRALATTYGTGILANSDFSAETKADLVHQHIKELAALAKDPPPRRPSSPPCQKRFGTSYPAFSPPPAAPPPSRTWPRSAPPWAPRCAPATSRRWRR